MASDPKYTQILILRLILVTITDLYCTLSTSPTWDTELLKNNCLQELDVLLALQTAFRGTLRLVPADAATHLLGNV